MKIKEVMERTGLSRKALEYYQEKGLVSPDTLENGWRDYSQEQVEALRKVALLRALDVPPQSIRALLSGEESPAELVRARELQRQRDARRDGLLRAFAQEGLSEALMERAEALLREESLARRFERLLPGYFGRMLISAYSPYLRQSAQNAQQEQAFREAAEFLDSLPPLRLPKELRRAVEEAAEGIDSELLEKTRQAKERAIKDPDGWMDENHDLIERYLKFKQSGEYQSLPVVQAGERLKSYLSETGFYGRFLPLLRRMSPAYDAYCQALTRADERFGERWGETKA